MCKRYFGRARKTRGQISCVWLEFLWGVTKILRYTVWKSTMKPFCRVHDALCTFGRKFTKRPKSTSNRNVHNWKPVFDTHTHTHDNCKPKVITKLPVVWKLRFITTKKVSGSSIQRRKNCCICSNYRSKMWILRCTWKYFKNRNSNEHPD